MRTETTTAAVLIGVVDGTTILLLFFVLLRSLWHCRSSSLLVEMMHFKLLVGCGVVAVKQKQMTNMDGLFLWCYFDFCTEFLAPCSRVHVPRSKNLSTATGKRGETERNQNDPRPFNESTERPFTHHSYTCSS
jgi:hypothetical protein